MTTTWWVRAAAVGLIAVGLYVFAGALHDALQLDECHEGLSRAGPIRGQECEDGTGKVIVLLVVGALVVAAGIALSGQALAAVGFGALAVVSAVVLWDNGAAAAQAAAVALLAGGAIVALFVVRAGGRRRRLLRDGLLLPGRVHDIHLAGTGRNFNGATTFKAEIAIQPPGQPVRLIRLQQDWRERDAPRRGDVVAVRLLGDKAIVDDRPASRQAASP